MTLLPKTSAVFAALGPVFLLAMALEGAACGTEQSSSSASDDTRYPVSAEGAPVLGPEDARVTIVEFVDIQCPYCSVSVRHVKELFAAHPDDLRVAFRHYPIPGLHPRAIPAALAVECAEDQGAFWEMLDRLVAKNASLDDDTIAAHARDLGMDMEAFEACLSSGDAMNRINADWQMGIDLGIHATPTLYINGRMVVGLQPSISLEMLFSQELQRAEALEEAEAADDDSSNAETDG